MSENQKKKTDVQRNAYQLTINNPLEKGYDHNRIKEILITDFSTLKFICMADEIGIKESTPHTHIYVYFNSRVRFSKIKKGFPEAHIEIAHGTVQANIDYIKKSGKWENTEKSETCIEGSYEEWGTVPTQKGVRPQYEELYQMIAEGLSNSDILAHNNDYILDIDKLDKVRFTLLKDKYKNTRRLDLKVCYVCGATGMGKTRDILDAYGDGNVYRVTDYSHPFDAYCCEDILVFEEFRSQLTISSMLNYCDIYSLQLPARYSNKVACYNKVYITTNWTLEEQYKEVQKDNPESWKAFLRRIHEVHIYHKDGTIQVFDSVEKYLNRNEQFHTISEAEQIELPFKD